VPCDLFFACADAGTVDVPGAERIAARAVVPAANVPCAPGAEEALRRRGVPLLPDFVVNTGGILGSFLASFGLPRARIEAFEVETYRRVARALLDRAAAASAEPVAFARAATEPRVARLLAMGWLARKGYGAFYRLARAPRPLRRLAAEAALLWAGAALRGRFR
jgi:glutamate dehydrogenase (NAD(P)+)